MDNQMMSQLLETYGFPKGAPVSARNANMIREFGAANPDVLERRSMRMRGSGIDDNSDLLNAMLERVMQETGASTQANPQTLVDAEAASRAALPTVQNSTGATRRSATAGSPSRQGNYGPGPSPSRQGNYGEASAPPGDQVTASETGAAGQATGTDMQVPGMQPNDSPSGGVPPWLQWLLGGGAAIAGASALNRNSPRATSSNAPQGSVSGEFGDQYAPQTSTKPAMKPGTGQTPEDIARMKAEVAQENRWAATADEALMEQVMKQQNTRKTLDAAKRAGKAVGRR